MYAKIGRPGIQHFRSLLNKEHILNCPFTAKDNEIAHNIFGQDVATIRGCKLRSSQTPIPRLALQDVPEELKRIHKNVRLFIDITFVNKNPFLDTISVFLGVRISQVLPDQFKESLLEFINNIM